MQKQKWLKLRHHGHSGRLRPHEYTSYGPLVLLLLVVGVALTITSVSALSPGPESSSIGLSGTMPGPAPKVAATISSPHSQQHFSTTPITVSGTCPAKTLVEIYKNDIFAGSTACGDNGTYSLDIDLLTGQNVLIARVYDTLNQPGPDSQSVTVFYDVLPSQAAALAPLNFGGAQMLLNTDAVYRGIFPNQQLVVPLDIIGGTPPYAVNVQWGDSTNKVIPRPDNQTFNAEHTYAKAGTYQITFQATDFLGRVAFLTVAAIVNGQPSTALALAGSSSNSAAGKLIVLWPVYTSAAAVVVSFWLGERREKRLLTSSPQLLRHA
jgi:hypothetical protein